MKRMISKLIAIAALGLGVAPSADAQIPEDFFRYEVLSGWRDADGTHIAAIRLTMADGWHTYWRTPGEAGIPPQFRLEPSDNLSGLAVHWPVPIRFEDNGYNSIGYTGEVVIPMRLRPETEGLPIALKGEVQIGVCDDICVPVWLEIDSVLPASGVPDAVIRAALKSKPLTRREARAGEVRCTVEAITDGLRLTAVLDLPEFGSDEFAVVEFADRSVWISEAQVSRDSGRLTAVAEMVPANGKPFLLQRDDLVFTVLADGRSVELSGCTAG